MSTESNLQERKLELIQWLSLVDDTSVLEKVEHLREQDNVDWWEMAGEEAKRSILTGVDDAENGKLRPHSEARTIYEKWL